MYVFDLSKSENQRWNEILEDRKDAIEECKDYFEEMVRPFQENLSKIESAINLANLLGQIDYSGEIKSISKVLGIPFWKIVLMQLCFEFYTASTALCAKVNGKYCMVRTIDSKFDFLKKLTVDLKVVKSGKTICYATTWIGFMGFLSFTKPGMCSVCANFRGEYVNPSEFVKEKGSSLKGYKQMGYSLRYASENYNNLEDLERYLKNTLLIRPCYFVMCHDNPYVLVREGLKKGNHYYRDLFYIANTDPENDDSDFMNSLNKTKKCSEVLRKEYFSDQEFIDSVRVNPILNQATIYTCYMSPFTDMHKSF